MSEKKGLSQNITSKLAVKRRKLRVFESWSEALVKQSLKFLACAQIEILNDFLCVKVSLCIKDMHWNTPPCRELQQIATQYFATILTWWQLYFFLTCGRSAFKPCQILKILDETCWCIPKFLLGWLKLNLN